MANEIVARGKLSTRLAQKFGVEAGVLLTTLKSTCFKQKDGVPVSDEQMVALLVVADQYNLNPFLKQIYAYPDKKGAGIVPVVGVDGWAAVINNHKEFDGADFTWAANVVELDGAKPCPEWVECTIRRKDRNPVTVREYLDECYRPPFSGESRDGKPYRVPGPWQSHTKRMLRHKALIQCSRVAFALTGIYDEDEAARIIEAEVVDTQPRKPGKPEISAPKSKTDAAKIADPEKPAQEAVESTEATTPERTGARPEQPSPASARPIPVKNQEEFEVRVDARRQELGMTLKFLENRLFGEFDITGGFGAVPADMYGQVLAWLDKLQPPNKPR